MIKVVSVIRMKIPETRFKISKARLFISLFVLLGLVVFVSTQFGEAKKLLVLIGNAKFSWLLVALGLQVATYVCDGAKWHISIKPGGYGLKIGVLTKMSIEQLSLNQFIPSIGMAGNAVVAREMLNIGVPAWVVAKAMSIDILSLLVSYVVMTVVAIFLLNSVVPIYIIWFLLAFLVFITSVTLGFIYFIYNHRTLRILSWLKRFKMIRITLEVMSDIPREEVAPVQLFIKASMLRLAIFVLDAITLYVLMLSIGIPVTLSASFLAFVAGSIGGVVSFLPGGIGGFEGACTWILVLFGTSLEAALAGTLLLRGFVLWLPLIPGLIFARRELFPYELLRNRGERQED
ncbi:MAG: flippase-like domain-containing protein [Candidatus Zambryskibacteria bacterium]|nr:flippase-like domain-containing protein [Candidatus Zambryskibacteria bacterium]